LGDTTLKVFGDRLELAWTNTEGADICFRLPKHFAFVPDSAELKQSASGDWIVPVSEKKLSGKITLK